VCKALGWVGVGDGIRHLCPFGIGKRLSWEKKSRGLKHQNWTRPTVQGGMEFGAVPGATARSHQHQNTSTWGLVSRSIRSISSLVPGIKLTPPPSVGGLDLNSSSSGCARLGSGLALLGWLKKK